MFLKSLQMTHFRKFDEETNIIEFAEPSSSLANDEVDAGDEGQGRTHIAADTTLIIGRNNAGKSTVVHAIRKLVSPSPSVRPSDFCYPYLKRLLDSAREGEAECPYIELRAGIAFDEDDSTANLGGFLALAHILGPAEYCVEIALRFSPADNEEVLEAVRAASVLPEEARLAALLTAMESTRLVSTLLAEDGTKIERANLGKLFACSEVPATEVSGEHCLSDAFGKILRHQRDALLRSDADKKGEFAATLFFELLTGGEAQSLVLPAYIAEALDDIANRTRGEAHAE